MIFNSLKLFFSIIHTCINVFIERLYLILKKCGLIYKNSEIALLKNKHAGRCFIICTGPSLSVEDLELIKDEYTISMNSIVAIYKETTWRPNCYMIQDVRAFDEVVKELSETSLNLCSQRVYKKNKSICKTHDFIEYYLKYGIHGSRLDKAYRTEGFSSEADIFIYDGYTVTYSAMQIAVFMGFKEIVLIGCDCNLSTANKKHFFETKNERILNWSTWDERMKNAYIVAKKYCDQRGVKIINASRGGNLDVFERRSLEEILKDGNMRIE